MTRPKPARPFVLRLAGGFVRAACRRVAPAVLAAALGACAGPSLPPIRTAASVDVDRFMGAWYVIGSIPISVEAAAHNAIERYRRDADGTIDTLYTYNDGGCRGPVARHTARGFVLDGGSGAVWGMQFIWPFKADYRIVYVAPDYGATIVGRGTRDQIAVDLFARRFVRPGIGRR